VCSLFICSSRLKCVVDADGRHSALFACIAELFQNLDIEVICSAYVLLTSVPYLIPRFNHFGPIARKDLSFTVTFPSTERRQVMLYADFTTWAWNPCQKYCVLVKQQWQRTINPF